MLQMYLLEYRYAPYKGVCSEIKQHYLTVHCNTSVPRFRPFDSILEKDLQAVRRIRSIEIVEKCVSYG